MFWGKKDWTKSNEEFLELLGISNIFELDFNEYYTKIINLTNGCSVAKYCMKVEQEIFKSYNFRTMIEKKYNDSGRTLEQKRYFAGILSASLLRKYFDKN